MVRKKIQRKREKIEEERKKVVEWRKWWRKKDGWRRRSAEWVENEIKERNRVKKEHEKNERNFTSFFLSSFSSLFFSATSFCSHLSSPSLSFSFSLSTKWFEESAKKRTVCGHNFLIHSSLFLSQHFCLELTQETKSTFSTFVDHKVLRNKSSSISDNFSQNFMIDIGIKPVNENEWENSCIRKWINNSRTNTADQSHSSIYHHLVCMEIIPTLLPLNNPIEQNSFWFRCSEFKFMLCRYVMQIVLFTLRTEEEASKEEKNKKRLSLFQELVTWNGTKRGVNRGCHSKLVFFYTSCSLSLSFWDHFLSLSL